MNATMYRPLNWPLNYSGTRSGSSEQAGTNSSALPSDPQAWLRHFLPGYIKADFGNHHRDFWNWAWSLEQGKPASTPAYVAIWPRGGAKSTSAEMFCAAMGALKKRRYVLYVSGTQDQADNHVQTIASMLETSTIGESYAGMGERRIGKYGNSQGWRRNRLWTASGFIVDAVGLDKAVRGLKLEDQRPDLIVLDDIDALKDTLDATQKKLDTLSKSVLPAGSSDSVVVAIQNLIIPDGVFTQIHERRTEILAERIVSGPIPAIENLEYRLRDEKSAEIIGGQPTWIGQDIAACQRLVDRIGITSFLEECQHEVGAVGVGKLVYPMFGPQHIKEPPVSWSECKWKLAGIDPGGGDPTAILAVGVDHQERVWVFDEFYRRDTVNDSDIHEWLSRWPGLQYVDIGETGGNFESNTLIRMGWPAVKAQMGRGEGIKAVRMLLDNGRIHISPRCVNLIAEFGLYRFTLATDEHTGERYSTSIPGKRHGDALDCLRYITRRLLEGLPARPRVVRINQGTQRAMGVGVR